METTPATVLCLKCMLVHREYAQGCPFKFFELRPETVIRYGRYCTHCCNIPDLGVISNFTEWGGNSCYCPQCYFDEVYPDSYVNPANYPEPLPENYSVPAYLTRQMGMCMPPCMWFTPVPSGAPLPRVTPMFGIPNPFKPKEDQT